MRKGARRSRSVFKTVGHAFLPQPAARGERGTAIVIRSSAQVPAVAAYLPWLLKHAPVHRARRLRRHHCAEDPATPRAFGRPYPLIFLEVDRPRQPFFGIEFAKLVECDGGAKGGG